VHAAARAQLAGLGGRHAHQSADAAVVAVAAQREAAAEVEFEVEVDRQWPPLARGGALGAFDLNRVVELRQRILGELEVAAVGTQHARDTELLAVEARAAFPGSDQAPVGPAEHAEIVGVPLERSRALLEGSARAQAAFAAGDARFDDPQAVSFQLGAQPPVAQRDAPRRHVEAERIAAHRPAEHGLRQGSCRAQRRRDSSRNARLRP
jgi:hypothetical protein